MRRPVSAPEVRDCDFQVLLVASVQEGVVVDAVSPAAPEHSEPGAAEGADRAWWSCPRVRAAAYLSWAQGWWCRVASASVEVAGRRRWSQPWRRHATLLRPDSTATGIMPASAARCSAVGYLARSSPISARSVAAQITDLAMST
jgi:hypothetical protein